MEKNIILKKKLILITESFPYSFANEDTFILPEIDILKNEFNISIYPLIRKGKKFDLDPQIELITCRSRLIIFKLIFNYIKHFINLLNEFFSSLHIFFKSPILLFKCILNWHNAIKLNITFNDYLKQNFFLNSDKILFYTYWFDYSTNSILLLKKKYKNIKCITRTHGYDLYFERNKGNYIPFRKSNIINIDKIFVACDFAKLYLENHFPFFSEKIIIAPLGTINHNFTPQRKEINKITLVSCSSVDNIKRVELIANSIIKLSQKIDNKYQIKWNHFGAGPLYNELKLLIENTTKSNLEVFLHGQKSNNEIINFYKNNYVDLFITLSTSEGGRPVSIQEAMSFGIPILATKVGGIIDIVHHNLNGVLIDVELSSNEILSEFEKILFTSDQIKSYLQENSRKIWQEKCNAINNHNVFLTYLLKE